MLSRHLLIPVTIYINKKSKCDNKNNIFTVLSNFVIFIHIKFILNQQSFGIRLTPISPIDVVDEEINYSNERLI